MQDFHKEFELAKAVIKEAGKLSLKYFSNDPAIIEEKDDKSWFTQADQATETFIRKKLFEVSPKYGFLGEETLESINGVSWLVDPIDGTSAYSRGIPEFGNVIALISDNNIVFSLVYFPTTNLLISAYINEGAYRNEEKMHVSKVSRLEMAIISSRRAFASEPLKSHITNLASKYKFRIGMSSSVESYYLANGNIDVSMRFNQPVWDVAPEVLIMREAGAIVTDVYSKPLNFIFTKDSKTSYIATNPELAKTAAETLYLK